MNHSLWIFYIARKTVVYILIENTRVLENTSFTSRVEHLNMTFTLIFIQLICTNTNCFYKIIIAKLLALNVLSIALYTF